MSKKKHNPALWLDVSLYEDIACELYESLSDDERDALTEQSFRQQVLGIYHRRAPQRFAQEAAQQAAQQALNPFKAAAKMLMEAR